MNFNQAWIWLITSSNDPLKTSTAIKGLLNVGIAYGLKVALATCALHLFCVPDGTADSVQTVVDAIGIIAMAVLSIVGAMQTLFGFFRKIQLGRWSHPAA